MECEGCGLTPGDLPLEKEEAEEFFVYVDGNNYCIGCNDVRKHAIDYFDGNGYDYEDFGDDR